jgi:hypothetical protein
MAQQTYILRINGVSFADANRYTEELRNTILKTVPDIIVHRESENPLAQSSGDMLILILGTPTVAGLATALGNWLLRRPNASFTLESSDKKIIAQNITSKDAARLTELLMVHQEKTDI